MTKLIFSNSFDYINSYFNCPVFSIGSYQSLQITIVQIFQICAKVYDTGFKMAIPHLSV